MDKKILNHDQKTFTCADDSKNKPTILWKAVVKLIGFMRFVWEVLNYFFEGG